MARYLIAFVAIIECALTDDHAHHVHAQAAPAPSYGAPAGPAPSYEVPAASAPSYGAPVSYTAPAAEYGVPSAEYGAPSAEYGAPSDAYGAPQQYADPTGYSNAYASEDDSEFDLLSMIDFPFFLAVFAAIINAQLFAPLLGFLFGAKLDLASGIFDPLTSAKIGQVNSILSPFNLVLGNVGDP